MKLDTTLYGETPDEYSRERKDCAVRAIKVAFDLTYKDAHDRYKAAGRLDRRPTPGHITSKVVASLGGSEPLLGNRVTVAKFLREHPKGRYVVRVYRHVFAVIDGVAHDWAGEGPRRRVRIFYKV